MTEGRAEMERRTQPGYEYHSCDFMDDGVYIDMNRLREYEDIDLTPEQIQELKERDTAKAAIITGYNRAIGCKVGECPKCGTMTRDYMNFCSDCGQRLRWEEQEDV